jgi:Protein of unknown function (DUF4239)
MSSIVITLISFACIFGAVLFGMVLSRMLPEHHLDIESKDAVKLGAALIATLTALVLGLLITSAKSSFDMVDNGLTEMSAKIIMLDRVLASYGPESKEVRDSLHENVQVMLKSVWPEKEGPIPNNVVEKLHRAELVQTMISALAPKTDTQRLLKSQALQINNDLMQQRWLLEEQRQKSLPTTVLVVLVFWLAMLFTSFGMFAPPHATIIVVYFISALSVACALFLILEMNTPLDGVIKVSSAPLHKALYLLGK